MTTKRPDYAEARNYYIKGNKNEYPTLQDIATEFNYSLSTLRKQAANEGWLKKRKKDHPIYGGKLQTYPILLSKKKTDDLRKKDEKKIKK